MGTVVEISSSSLASSKSLLNRALIVRSFFPQLKIDFNREFLGDDVIHLQKSLDDFEKKKTFNCGEGAAPLRFLAVRLSRLKGNFEIEGSPRLFSRPHESLVSVLSQLGCRHITLKENSLSFESLGQWPSSVSLSTDQTSQVYSALLLSSWMLPQDFEIHVSSFMASESYAQMTESMLERMGLCFEKKIACIRVKPFQKVKEETFFVEPDMSCAAAVAALGLIKKGVVLRGLPERSLQGDKLFFELLSSMGADFLISNEEHKKINITIHPSLLVGIDVNLSSTPDLFPVLAALAARAISKSTFRGLENLNVKESPRLQRIHELLSVLGVKSDILKNSENLSSLAFEVHPASFSQQLWPSKEILFSTDNDHRLAMAAAILKLAGAPLSILNPDCVQKSFPNFWGIFQKFDL
jgi:3-phosphoshikimate 1-carboxyvinyltransferase